MIGAAALLAVIAAAASGAGDDARSAAAATLDEVGYTALRNALGSATPDGSGVPVTQVEADSNRAETTIEYGPNPALFPGKIITDASKKGMAPSGHANGVARPFFGERSMAAGIDRVEAYWVADWINTGFLYTGLPAQPDASASRIANHSWVARAGDIDGDILRRLDWTIDRDDYINVTGFSGTAPLLSSAFNVIAVNRTNKPVTTGSGGADSVYTKGRVRPHLVVPQSSTSMATPYVAAAAALLVGTAHANPALSDDPVTERTRNRNGDTIFNAERAEVIRAALMAGAARNADNETFDDISDYRQDSSNRTDNGLDIRFGAGQLNIFNSYRIIAGGEQNSLEDKASSRGAISAFGFDYDPSFGGGAGSNGVATYFFSTGARPLEFAATLAWHLKVDGGDALEFGGAATLFNLNLSLYDVSDPDNRILLFKSAGTSDNTETVWTRLGAGRDYALQVGVGRGQPAFEWDYGLAWRLGGHTAAPAAFLRERQ